MAKVSSACFFAAAFDCQQWTKAAQVSRIAGKRLQSMIDCRGLRAEIGRARDRRGGSPSISAHQSSQSLRRIRSALLALRVAVARDRSNFSGRLGGRTQHGAQGQEALSNSPQGLGALVCRELMERATSPIPCSPISASQHDNQSWIASLTGDFWNTCAACSIMLAIEWRLAKKTGPNLLSPLARHACRSTLSQV